MPLLDAPYARTVGLELVRATATRVQVALPHHADNANRNGTLHGGVLASLIDVAAAAVARGDAVEGRTADLAIHYVAPARRERVTAEARLVRRGRAVTFVAVDVSGAQGTSVARALVAYRSGSAGATPANGLQPPAVPARARPSGSPFGHKLGVRSARLGPGEAVSLLPAGPAVTDRNGSIHEGAIAVIVDSAGGAAAWSIVGFDPSRRASTIALHLAVHAPAYDEDLVAHARIAAHGATIFTSHVTVATRDSGRIVATGSVTYRIVG